MKCLLHKHLCAFNLANLASFNSVPNEYIGEDNVSLSLVGHILFICPLRIYSEVQVSTNHINMCTLFARNVSKMYQIR